MAKELEYYQTVERSLIKKYRKELWNPFIRGVKKYRLVGEGDKIAVCISGGKDSMCMAKLMQQLQRISDVKFELVFLCMDPGYSPANRAKIEDNSKKLNIPLTVFESNIFDIADRQMKNPCYICAKMRRGALYDRAKALGCNKIALGHHFNDVIETTVMGMFWGAQLQAMLPKLHSTNFPGMELIRPMYCVHEDDIIAWQRYNGLEFLACACKFTERTATRDKESESKRKYVKNMLKEMKKTSPDIEKCIFNAIHTVQLDTFPGWKDSGGEHSFLDNY
ncbi:MAG: tRNA 2-thiocytidine biosynthesis TtcA family protein [Oscillospiraceae bacterium]|nr:tRNA 2-thiocytidine biosynthesis TtcA family protein [Oscillospiraceae bacterium]